jgi:hypothetical protein
VIIFHCEFSVYFCIAETYEKNFHGEKKYLTGWSGCYIFRGYSVRGFS